MVVMRSECNMGQLIEAFRDYEPLWLRGGSSFNIIPQLNVQKLHCSPANHYRMSGSKYGYGIRTFITSA